MTGQFIKEISIDWSRIDDDSYLRSIPALQFDGPITFDGNVTFFVGENGSGKSTLLEAIAVAYGFNPEGGTRNYNFTTYDSHSQLHQAIRVVKGIRRPKGSYFLRAESFFSSAISWGEFSGFHSWKFRGRWDLYSGRAGGRLVTTAPVVIVNGYS